MINSTAIQMANKIAKPNSKIDINQLANLLLDKSIDDNKRATQTEINIVDFCRFYKVGHIPVIDFLVGYVILYVLNNICPKFDYRLILIGTIPLVIIFNLATNEDIQTNLLLLLILVGSIIYLIKMNNLLT